MLTMEIMRVSFPVSLSLMVIYLAEASCIAIVGHLEDQKMTAAIGLSLSFTNVTCLAAFYGFNNGLNVLVATAFG